MNASKQQRSKNKTAQVQGFLLRGKQAGVFLSVMMLAACGGLSKQPDIEVTQNTLKSKLERPERSATQTETIGDGRKSASDNAYKRPFNERLTQNAVPALIEDEEVTPTEGEKAPDPGTKLVDAAVPPLALPAFLDVVFGEILKVPYATGPDIAARKDIIQLRSSGQIPAQDFLALVSKALVDYGVRIAPAGGLYQIVEEENARERTPQLLRSRSRPSTPSGLRPVIQFVQLQAMDALGMRNMLLQAFPRGGALDIQHDNRTGSVILRGLPEDIDAALDIIEAMDDLAFSGSQVLQYRPVFWEVAAFAQQLDEVMSAEGWQISIGNREVLPIHLVPILYSNNLLIFVKDEQARKRLVYWLELLDQPAQSGDADQIFIFDVQNTDATILAETANAVLSGITNTGEPQEVTAAGSQASSGGAGQSSGSGSSGGGLVVDPQGNRLIFSGSASEYQRILPLLRRLDQAVSEVLIEVTVAEITLTDETQYGVEFFVDSVGGDGVDVDFGTSGGLGLAGSGLNVGFVSGDVTAALNAFAQNQQVNVLSTPRLVARSGGAASIQVGADVPVITSQTAADQQSGGGQRDVLQSVQFRSTGVLLNIEPIVFSTGRIDLTLTQEVSTALPNPNAAIASPIISNRSLNTQLTLEDGGTAVLGGLIQDSVTRGDTGVPLLKDIPVLGSLFSVDSLSVERTELLVIITAYIIRDSEDRARFVDYLVNDINKSLGNPKQLNTRLPNKF